MTDIRKIMAPVSCEIEKEINNIVNQKWAIPFLGRKLNSACKKKFKDAEIKGFKVELPWEGQVGYERHNGYDESTYVHELVVEVNPDSLAGGRIKSVHAHHWEHWHTSSNWQDHSENHSWEKREPNEQEITQYKELLDGWTEGGTSELIDDFYHALAAKVREQNGKIKVDFCHKKVISISDLDDESSNTCKDIDINLDHLIEALDYSRIFIEAINSREDRQRLGICNNEKWTLQYCLNLFNVFKSEKLYQNINLSLRAWLYKLYTECSFYRDFMKIQQDLWWRDAWWRLQEIIEGKERVLENQTLIKENLYKYDYNAKARPNIDPLASLVGRISLSHKNPIEPFSIESATTNLGYWEDGVRKQYEFTTVTNNGIKWSVCYLPGGNIAIDLATSEATEELKDGEVQIPYQINGCPITSIHMLDCAVEKDWKKIVFLAPTKDDLKSDYIAPPSSISEFDIEEDDDEFVEYHQVTKYEEYLSIEKGAFRGWKMLEEIIFERKKTILQEYAFDGCVNLKRVIWGENTCCIRNRCFFGCTSLSEIGTIRDYVGCESFKNCTSLKHLIIKYSPHMTDKLLGKSAFEECTALETIHIEIDDKNNNYENKEKKCFSLPYRAFWGCTALKQIYLSKSVRILEKECFGDCTSKCVLEYEGEAFWFFGENAISKIKAFYYWESMVCYDMKSTTLSKLLEKHGIKRDQYIKVTLAYNDDISFKEIIEIAKGNDLPSRRRNYHNNYDSYDDWSPRTFDDAEEIWGSRLWDA